ncbi:MAG: hypothetical protein FJ295_03735 [Planctomycetes bacterium]|nr:hypothetical protein [Planctomycetota bacterium]
MDFEQRLQKAIERGQQRGEVQSREAAARAMSQDEMRQLHSRCRLELSEHIEDCLRRLAHHLPGFQLESIFGERGWGTAVSRDALRIERGQRDRDFSRLEITVRPIGPMMILEIVARGTIRNREMMSRNLFEAPNKIDLTKFKDQIDRWVLEFAEGYAADG